MCGEISTKGFSKFCKLMSNLILGQISVSNLNTNVHKLASKTALDFMKTDINTMITQAYHISRCSS